MMKKAVSYHNVKQAAAVNGDVIYPPVMKYRPVAELIPGICDIFRAQIISHIVDIRGQEGEDIGATAADIQYPFAMNRCQKTLQTHPVFAVAVHEVLKEEVNSRESE